VHAVISFRNKTQAYAEVILRGKSATKLEPRGKHKKVSTQIYKEGMGI
jgi:hypothetical protein